MPRDGDDEGRDGLGIVNDSDQWSKTREVQTPVFLVEFAVHDSDHGCWHDEDGPKQAVKQVDDDHVTSGYSAIEMTRVAAKRQRRRGKERRAKGSGHR